MNNTTKVVVGLALAAATGAAIGMLLAPEKGTDLQKRIKEGASDFLKEFNGFLTMGKEMLNQINAAPSNDIDPQLSESEFSNSISPLR